MTTEHAPPFTLPELPAEIITELKNLRRDDQPALYAYVSSLRKNNWPLRSIATPLGVSRTAVMRWSQYYDGSVPQPPTESLPVAPTRQANTVYAKVVLTKDQKKQLYTLAQEASKVRRYTDPIAQSRKDANQLEQLLLKYTKEGASLGQLALACGVSRSSIAQRLRKY